MKKSLMIPIVIATSVLVIFCAITLFFNSSTDDWFGQHREDFDLINEYVIENFECPPNSEQQIVSFVFDGDRQVVSLHCNGEYYPLSDNLKNAFSAMISLAKGKNLDTIRISSKRIDYFGLGNRAFVYSRDGKRPTYLYSEDEHLLGFKAYDEGEGWYYLHFYQ